MYLAEEAAAEVSRVQAFDFIMLAFTIVIAIGVFRLLKAPQKNIFAIGFGIVSLAVFLFIDVLMIMYWMGSDITFSN
ncbi:DUF2759 family protein [Paenibacillus thermoaerophilus]|uniref:DUF2759 family protein n=1 Tax=Paenibacillus thermoaerophilus TaxID=1215385 RepID=A0ABW2VAU8_9BACL|nr:DUF2759 family protein [Paenibacillus thermoaerophilus]TMV09193.1 DUF2759 family protein [Paenibacillus thermoaerophilus]